MTLYGIWLFVLNLVEIVALIAVFLNIALYFIYRFNKTGEQTLPFRSFKAVYSVKPHAWELEDSTSDAYAKYYKDGRSRSWGATKIYMRNYIDYLRFVLFAKRENKKRKDAKLNNEMEELIESWQRDINHYKHTAECEINDMISRVNKSRR